MATDRWATFDCYGTLIDWNAGIRAELALVFGEEHADTLLERYHQVELSLQAAGSRTYREVLAGSMRELGGASEEAERLAESLPSWQPFPEARAAIEEARARGWRLAVLSNSDPDLINASLQRLGVPFDLTIVASEIGSYKPSHRHWLAFFDRTGVSRDRHVHVAQSHFHDIAPAYELGLRSIWINRLAERHALPPTRELSDLEHLSDTLDELVAA